MSITWREALTGERMLRREHLRAEPKMWCATSTKGVVSSAHYLASAAGAEILELGGNVVDAAIATSLALGVVEPAASGLGGMGMLLYHDVEQGRTVCFEGACRAPQRATARAVKGGPRKNTHRAAALPVLPALLDHVWKKQGTLSRETLFQPAIRLAEAGFLTTSYQAQLSGVYQKVLRRLEAAAHFLGEDGQPRPTGTLFRQPALAKTLTRLAHEGFEDFYLGQIASEIIADMVAKGGFLSADDFEEVPRIGESLPLSGRFGRWEISTLPPPGGGPTLLQILHLFDALEVEDLDPCSPEAAALFAATIRRARVDRIRAPTGSLTSDDGAESALWSPSVVQRGRDAIRRELSEGETTHFCIIDGAGNAVSMTQSIERSFGAKVVTPSLGFLYNGYLKTFKVENRAHPFYLRPGARARSNAAPTLAFDDGRLCLAIGSTGSERMASGIMQVMVRLRSGQEPFAAVAAPRLHCTPEGEVLCEAPRMGPGVCEHLEGRGFRITPYSAWAFEVGGLHLALFDGRRVTGVAEPRRDGAVAAL